MKRRNMTAMAMAAMMIMANVSPSVMAFANDVTLNGITQNNTGKTEGDVTAQNGANYTTDSVTGEVTAEGANTTVTVKENVGGDVKASESATVNAGSTSGKVEADKATVKVDGTIGGYVKAENGATVNAGSVAGGVAASNKGTTVEVTNNIGGGVNAQSGSNVSAGSTSGKVEASGSGTTVEVTNNIGGGVDAQSGAKVEAGSVTGEAKAAGSGTTVTVEEDADRVEASNSATVTVDGTAGSVDAKTAATVYVGSVTNTVTAADNGTTVTVTYDAGNVDAKNSAKVTVGGDLITTDGDAIKITGNNVSVIVKGDVETFEENDKLSIDASDSDGTNNEIAIGGTLKNGENGATLAVATTEDSNGETVDTTKLPEIVVGTIEDVKNLTVTNSDGRELSEEETQKVIDNIKYIIDEKDLANGKLTITKFNNGSNLEWNDSMQCYVATKDTAFKVQVEVDEGYELTGFDAGSGKVYYNNNDEHCYVVEVPEGGGVSLKAVLTLIKKAEEAKKTETTTTTTTTVTRTSSGGGSGSSSGSHAIAVTPGAGRTSIPTTPGSWKKNADNTWSYVNADGSIYKSSWIVSNNRWYYADANGRIVTSWMEINGVWYYFSVTDSTANPEGSMLAGTTTPDGYKLDSNGAWVK